MIKIPLSFKHFVEKCYDQTNDENKDSWNTDESHESKFFDFLDKCKANFEYSQNTNDKPRLNIKLSDRLRSNLRKYPIEGWLKDNEFCNTDADIVDHDHERRGCFGFLWIKQVAHDRRIVTVPGKVFGF